VLLGEVGDPANHAAAPARFRIDQHRHVLHAELTVILVIINAGNHRKLNLADRPIGSRQRCGKVITIQPATLILPTIAKNRAQIRDISGEILTNFSLARAQTPIATVILNSLRNFHLQ
jgi:hypothetical protein